MKGYFSIVGITGLSLALLFAFSLAMNAAGLWVAPWFANQQTQIQRNTINYTDAKAEYMLRLVRDYSAAGVTKDQQQATYRLLCEQVHLTPTNLTPDSVQVFVSQHGGCR